MQKLLVIQGEIHIIKITVENLNKSLKTMRDVDF